MILTDPKFCEHLIDTYEKDKEPVPNLSIQRLCEKAVSGEKDTKESSKDKAVDVTRLSINPAFRCHVAPPLLSVDVSLFLILKIQDSSQVKLPIIQRAVSF